MLVSRTIIRDERNTNQWIKIKTNNKSSRCAYAIDIIIIMIMKTDIKIIENILKQIEEIFNLEVSQKNIDMILLGKIQEGFRNIIRRFGLKKLQKILKES